MSDAKQPSITIEVKLANYDQLATAMSILTKAAIQLMDNGVDSRFVMENAEQLRKAGPNVIPIQPDFK